jgi:hypothetical protein
MTENKFWEIIDQSQKEANGSQDAQEKSLKKLLLNISADEVASFNRIFNELLAQSYTWDLWGAAYIIDGGCSDDGFEYFRRGLIATGREKFERAWEDPEYVAYAVYEEKTGADAIPDDKIRYGEVKGEPWEEDSDDLEKRFPRLWAKFDT